MSLGNEITITVTKQPLDSFYEVCICVPIGLGQKDECDALANELRQSVAKTQRVLSALSDDFYELYESLRSLYDEQNGPPLLRRAKQWQAAMDKARTAIAKATPQEQ